MNVRKWNMTFVCINILIEPFWHHDAPCVFSLQPRRDCLVHDQHFEKLKEGVNAYENVK